MRDRMVYPTIFPDRLHIKPEIRARRFRCAVRPARFYVSWRILPGARHDVLLFLSRRLPLYKARLG